MTDRLALLRRTHAQEDAQHRHRAERLLRSIRAVGPRFRRFDVEILEDIVERAKLDESKWGS
jgi:hypothetical protein